jgi:Lrp/AsnC family transcriptional regulator for asnA, asnC and gidA
MTASLDDLDRRVIHELEEDGRRAFRDIARGLGVSEATVRARVRRLESTGVLKIVAFADPAQLGQLRLALALITVAAGHHGEVLACLTKLPEVAYVSTILGPADICAQVLVKDDATLWRFVTEQLRGLVGITDVQTIVEVEVHKLRYASPLPQG